MTNFKKCFKQISNAIKAANKIAILTHISPDIDCLGSAFGLKEGLKQLGKDCTIFNADQLPDAAFKLFDCKEIKTKAFKNKDFDLIISVDVATTVRHGIFTENFEKHPNRIKFDHHLNSEVIDGLCFINDHSSSCAEIICELLKFMKIKFTKEVSTYLYAGMAADSGSFKYPITNVQTFEHAIFLKEHDADCDKLNDAIFRSKSKKEIGAQKLLLNKYETIDDKFALIVMDKKDLEANKLTKQDCDFFSPALLDIEGIEISCSAIWLDEKSYKLSFRSRKDLDVAKYCQALGGGGHKNAAGVVIMADKRQQAKAIAVKTMRDCFNEFRK